MTKMCVHNSQPGALEQLRQQQLPLEATRSTALMICDTCASPAGNAHQFCGRHFMAWRYYDFDANWDKVYKVWQGDAVQDVLKPDMEEWCEKHAYYNRDEDGHLRKPTWHRGDSLWRYSVTDYHSSRSMEAANMLMRSENVAEQLLAALRRHGLGITMDQLRRDDGDRPGIWTRAFFECERRCSQKRGTLESMILWSGEGFLENATYECARELFPEEVIALDEFPPGCYYHRVFLCKQKLVFDFHGYWFHKQGEADAVCPQPW